MSSRRHECPRCGHEWDCDGCETRETERVCDACASVESEQRSVQLPEGDYIIRIVRGDCVQVHVQKIEGCRLIFIESHSPVELLSAPPRTENSPS